MNNNAQKFEKFEENRSLFELTIQDVPIWERIRRDVHMEIQQQSGFSGRSLDSSSTVSKYVNSLSLLLKNTVYRNPYLVDTHQYAFFSTGRRTKQDDGTWWNIYCDPLYQDCNIDAVHFEAATENQHFRPARTGNLRYVDLIKYGSKIQSMLGVKSPQINSESEHKIEKIEEEINTQFDTNINLLRMIRSEIQFRNIELPMYTTLLDRIDPSTVVITCSYGKETLIEACKQKNITVVELQHGIINERHFGYSYSGSRKKKTFPDYLLVWGDFWKNTVEYPIPSDRVISVGYPYLERKKSQYTESQPQDQIIFISQATIGTELSKFAVEVSEHSDITHNIVYKLHPLEFGSWKAEYPWLVEAGLTVIDRTEPPLYELFSESSAQIGVYSTAIYEGLCFDLETYLFDCMGVKQLQTLIDDGTARVVSSTEELESSLGELQSSIERERFFKSNAIERSCRTLQEIAPD